MDEKIQKHQNRYEFEHIAFPSLFYEMSPEACRDLIINSNFAYDSMRRLLSKKQSFPYAEADFKKELVELDENMMVCWITMPKPEFLVDCWQICLVFNLNNKDERDYFTIEYGFDDKLFVCEWDKDQKHSNYGVVESMEAGREKINVLIKREFPGGSND